MLVLSLFEEGIRITSFMALRGTRNVCGKNNRTSRQVRFFRAACVVVSSHTPNVKILCSLSYRFTDTHHDKNAFCCSRKEDMFLCVAKEEIPLPPRRPCASRVTPACAAKRRYAEVLQRCVPWPQPVESSELE